VSGRPTDAELRNANLGGAQAEKVRLKAKDDRTHLRRLSAEEVDLPGNSVLTLGVIVSRGGDGSVQRRYVYSWQDVVEHFRDDPNGPPWTPYEVTQTLGCGLTDLGLLSSTWPA
jgi:hypothetical protein